MDYNEKYRYIILNTSVNKLNINRLKTWNSK